MSDCGDHSDFERLILDAMIDEYVRAYKASMHRYVCADCGRRVEVPPYEDVDEAHMCCGWEMVELLPD